MLRKASWGQELVDSMVSGDPYGDQGRWSVQWEEGVTNWPLSQYRRKTSPAETEPFSFRGGELGQRGTMALATEQVLNDF